MRSSEAVILDGIEYGDRLPRGRHGIPHELIAANQRERLLSATASVIAERGYASLAVSDLTERAGVSRATFYKLFDDKHHCVLEAQGWAIDRLRRRRSSTPAGRSPPRAATGRRRSPPGSAPRSTSRPSSRVRRASCWPRATRRRSRSWPARDWPCTCSWCSSCTRERSGSPARGRRAASPSRPRSARRCRLPAIAWRPGELDALPELRADLVQIVLMPYLGAAEARRIARGRLMPAASRAMAWRSSPPACSPWASGCRRAPRRAKAGPLLGLAGGNVGSYRWMVEAKRPDGPAGAGQLGPAGPACWSGRNGASAPSATAAARAASAPAPRASRHPSRRSSPAACSPAQAGRRS